MLRFANSLFGRVVIALVIGIILGTISLVTSKGAHGIPGSAIVILAATLTAVPAIPVIGLVLILPVDWFIGIGRAITNLIGNCVATRGDRFMGERHRSEAGARGPRWKCSRGSCFPS